MRRLALLVLLLGCHNPATPGELYPGYFLSSVDGRPLPTATPDLPDGYVLVSGALGFGSSALPGDVDVVAGLVTYTQIVRDPDQVTQHWTTDLSYSVSGGELRINLCPPLALCIVSTELVGPADRTELVLTHVLAGQPRAVYRFLATLPD